MKKSMAAIGVALIVGGLILFAYFFGYFELEEDNEVPEAKIEINNIISDTSQDTIVINIGDNLVLNAENSSDMDGKIKNYNWDFGDGYSKTGMTQTHSYSQPGSYNVTLTVIDDDGAQDITWIIIKVNTPPIALAMLDTNATLIVKGNVLIYDPVYFLATGCYDPDGTHYKPSEAGTWSMDLNYYWEFGDGNTSTSENPLHNYQETGTYTVKLTVTDNNNAKAMDSFKIEVILRSFEITWQTGNGTQSDSGYTTEFSSSTRTHLINPPAAQGLSKVVFELQWTDWFPLLNASAGPDEFELKVTTPEEDTKVANGTNEDNTGIIVITFDFNVEPDAMNVQAISDTEAKIDAEKQCSLTPEGLGDWVVNITAVDCQGWDWADGILDLDKGSGWDLRIDFYYYEMEINEIDY
jgi:PKD repeat protein